MIRSSSLRVVDTASGDNIGCFAFCAIWMESISGLVFSYDAGLLTRRVDNLRNSLFSSTLTE